MPVVAVVLFVAVVVVAVPVVVSGAQQASAMRRKRQYNVPNCGADIMPCDLEINEAKKSGKKKENRIIN